MAFTLWFYQRWKMDCRCSRRDWRRLKRIVVVKWRSSVSDWIRRGTYVIQIWSNNVTNWRIGTDIRLGTKSQFFMRLFMKWHVDISVKFNDEDQQRRFILRDHYLPSFLNDFANVRYWVFCYILISNIILYRIVDPKLTIKAHADSIT